MQSMRFWESLLYDDLEELHSFFVLDEAWQAFLDQDSVLDFLSLRYDMYTPVSNFVEFYALAQNHGERRTTPWLDPELDAEDYINETDNLIDIWSLILVLQSRDVQLLENVATVYDYWDIDEASVQLLLFVLGHDGTEEMADLLLKILTDYDVDEYLGWGPIAIGLAASGNTEMYSYLYEDLLTEQYYDTFQYYQEWTLFAIRTAKHHHQVQILALLEAL